MPGCKCSGKEKLQLSHWHFLQQDSYTVRLSYKTPVSYKTAVAERVKIRILFTTKPTKPECGWVSWSVCGLLDPQSQAYVSASQARVSPSTSYTPSRHKRSYEEDEDMDLHPSKQKEQHMGKSCCWWIVVLMSFQDLAEKSVLKAEIFAAVLIISVVAAFVIRRLCWSQWFDLKECGRAYSVICVLCDLLTIYRGS